MIGSLMTSGNPGVAAGSGTIRVLVAGFGLSPYTEEAPAFAHAIFRTAVLGRLLRIDASLNLVPDCIEKWTALPKEKSILLTLRTDLIFHNGRRVDAKDLEFSLVRGLLTPRRSFYLNYLKSVEGASDVAAGTTYQPGLVKGIKVVGPYEVRIQLKTFLPHFIFLLARSYFALVPKEAMKADGVTWIDKPIGVGPYKVVKAFDGESVDLTWAGHTPLPEKAARNIQVLTKQPVNPPDVSIVWQDAPELKREFSRYTAALFNIAFSNKNELGRDPNFRQAVRWAIDRDSVNEGLEIFSPAYEFLPRQLWGRPNLKNNFSISKAKEFVSKIPPELVKQRWTASLFSGQASAQPTKTRIERILKQLEQVGLHFDVEVSSDKFFVEERAKRMPIVMQGIISDHFDPVVSFSSLHSSSAFTTIHPSEGKAFDTLYEDALHEVDPDKRRLKIHAMSKFVEENALNVAISEDKVAYFYNPETIESIGEPQMPGELDLSKVRVRTAN
jgi:ABC-type transport system substrate-binding protein